eukprot:897909-Rhodomonas_salina.1
MPATVSHALAARRRGVCDGGSGGSKTHRCACRSCSRPRSVTQPPCLGVEEGRSAWVGVAPPRSRSSPPADAPPLP